MENNLETMLDIIWVMKFLKAFVENHKMMKIVTIFILNNLKREIKVRIVLLMQRDQMYVLSVYQKETFFSNLNNNVFIDIWKF